MKINKIKKAPKVLNAMLGPKIFCLSLQRTGTTSVGQFFKDHGFRVATWVVSRNNDFTTKWFKGDYESIFNSRAFKINQVFEDDPWWCSDFYKVLFHRFPKSKFVMLERNPDKWFDSMVKHSRGKSLGNTHLHATIYQRLYELNKSEFENVNRYTSKIDNLLTLEEKHREHYVQFYKNRNNEVKDYFDFFGNNRLVTINLEDPKKWQVIGSFFDVDVDSSYEAHSNNSIV